MDIGKKKGKYISFFKKSLKAVKENKKGVTLIELIVSFALISLFVVLSCQVISSALDVYHKIQSINYGRQVSDTLMDKIAGTISSAQVSNSRVNIENEDLNTKYTLQITDDMSKIDLYNGSGSHIYITKAVPDTGGDEQLVIHYYRVESVQQNSSKKLVFEPVDWTFDKKMYVDYHINELKFSLADPTGNVYPKNVIKVELEIENSRLGKYSATRYVECYNFQEEDDFDKISGPGKDTGDKEEEIPNPSLPSGEETYGETDIVVKTDYWPKGEDFQGDEIIWLQPGNIFKYSYEDGDKYYVMVQERDLNASNYHTPDVYIANGNKTVFELTGKVVEYKDENDIQIDLKHGDLCIWNGEYYAYKGSNQEVKNPGIHTEAWVKIVNDRKK